MAEQKKKISIGVLAHVDAGKTTLSEALLYRSGQLRNLGRVDHQDAFLDTDRMERARGITIFSKQAVFPLGEMQITLLDTPGHVDFSAEMERTLQVLDYAILVINGADGVQGHTETLWKLLERYGIPVFLFINKMDQEGADRQALTEELQKRLSPSCIVFSDAPWTEEETEQLALCDEGVLEHYLENGIVTEEEIRSMIAGRRVFPCYFGSALKVQGVDAFLEGLQRYLQQPVYGEQFAARVFKITRDEQGNRLTHLKVSGGRLRVRTQLGEEKINQIRIYSGTKFETAEEVEAGSICAVTGLMTTAAGQGLGAAAEGEKPMLQPVLNYQLIPPEGCDLHQLYAKLKVLEEEAPELHFVWHAQIGEIHAHLMGEVQTEILIDMIRERFGLEISFGAGKILYQETIADTVEGVGHFEPLRHYAEVHLLMEPGTRGSGLLMAADCSEDLLDRNWQRLILTHLAEREHPGVLCGAPITDMKITLVAGKAHLKHTEGGDFRQACYRAVRQGLMQAESVLLEPVYSFRIEVPAEQIGRAMSDIQRMSGTFESPQQDGATAVITGEAPVATMRDYQKELIAYTRGRGRISCVLKGYAPCHNTEEVLAEYQYQPEADTENPSSSVFCAHGAGFTVPYDKVFEYMHLESVLKRRKEAAEAEKEAEAAVGRAAVTAANKNAAWKEAGHYIGDKDLEEIFVRTYGPIRNRSAFASQGSGRKKDSESASEWKQNKAAGKHTTVSREEYLLVDGYNIIFAWEDLKQLAEENLDAARGRLLDILSNYQGYTQKKVIAVFDAYRVQGHRCEELMYHNVHVVYTKEAMTADQYIERLVHEIGRKYQVTVATSDQLEQIIIWGQGGTLLSARGLKEEIERVNQQIRTEYLEKQRIEKTRLAEFLPEMKTE